MLSAKTTFGKLLRMPLRLIAKDAVVPILRGKARGTRWIVGSGLHSFWLGTFEVPKRKQVERAVKTGDVVYDVGAHVGIYMVLFARLVGQRGRVFAFEPVPSNVNFLERHIALNRLTNVTVFKVAASDEDGSAQFDDFTENSMGKLSAAGRLTVRTVRLDTLVRNGEIPPPTHIKMDIEGAEVKALQGLIETLRTHRPTIFLATHGEEIARQCRALLEELNYKVTPIAGSGDEFLATCR